MKHRVSFSTRFLFLLLILCCLVVSPPAQVVQGQDPVDSTGETGAEIDSPLFPGESEAVTRAFSGGPSYDSGWIPIARMQTRILSHNLGGQVSDYVVDMQFRSGDENSTSQRNYGGNDLGTNPSAGLVAEDRVGAYWYNLTASAVTVYRRPDDIYADEVRIRIWVDPLPDYNGTWSYVNPDETLTLSHNLLGDVDDYVVDMQFKSTAYGINQRYYGGCDYSSKIETKIGSPDDRVGAYWRSLTNTSLVVYRRPEDIFAEQVRVRIWRRPKPTFDSDWVAINQDQAISMVHNIGGSPDDYQVVMDFKAADINGINQRAYGGMDAGNKNATIPENARAGAYWRTLTNSNVVVYRRPEDPYAPQIRIRIFRFWKPTPPDYDSGWKAIRANSSIILTHALGGSVDSYMVDLQFHDLATNGVNQRAYGGMDIGASPSPGLSANDRVGAYWRSLSSSTITVVRRPDDIYAAEVRVRIWKMPEPDYNSGWQSKDPGTVTPLTHNLGGDYQEDYLVYLDFYSASNGGRHQLAYGGMDNALTNERVGAYWRQLTNSGVIVYRQPGDLYVEQFRLRIWRIQRADYSSDWVTMNQDQAVTLAHNLGSVAAGYFVQVSQWDTYSENTLNHMHYGGADFGSQPPAGSSEDDRVGSYWRSLTEQEIVVYRRPEDLYSELILVRIWDISRKSYLPMITK